MKNLTFYILLIFCYNSFAQSNNYHPYKHIGGDDIEMLTLSKGKYNEFFGADSIEIIGSAILNTNTMEVIGFVEKDTLYSEATLEPEIVSRFLSTDPLGAEFPYMSPYVYAGNMPIAYIDADGLGPILVVASVNQTKSVQAALKQGDYKEVQRILYYGANHDYVDANGQKSDYLKNRIEKEHGVSIPEGGTLMNLGNTKDGITKIYGIKETEDGKIEPVLLGEVKLEIFNEEVDKALDYENKTPSQVFADALNENISIIDKKIKPLEAKVDKLKQNSELVRGTHRPVVRGNDAKAAQVGEAIFAAQYDKEANKITDNKIKPLKEKKESIIKIKDSKGEK